MRDVCKRKGKATVVHQISENSPSLIHHAFGHPLGIAIISLVLHVELFKLVNRILHWSKSCSHEFPVFGCFHLKWFFVGAYLISIILVPIFLFFCRPLHKRSTIWTNHNLAISVNASRVTCSHFLSEKRNLDQYEQKVDGCRATNDGFTIWGRWFGLPWIKSFEMTAREGGGFHAQLKEDHGLASYDWCIPSVLRFKGSGGFILSNVSDLNTVVTHYESYGWPLAFPFSWLLMIPVRDWHYRGMQVEMEVIKAQLELLQEATNRESKKEAIGQSKSPVSPYAPDIQSNKLVWSGWKYTHWNYLIEAAGMVSNPYRHPAIENSNSPFLTDSMKK